MSNIVGLAKTDAQTARCCKRTGESTRCNGREEEEEEKISHRQLGPLGGSSSPFQHFEPVRVKPN